MKTMKIRVLLALMAVCLLVATGCQTEQTGVTNRAGTIRATIGAGPAAVEEAAEEVLEDMGMIIISSNSSAIDSRTISRSAQDVKIRVDSEKVGDDISRVSIRIGGMGDSELSLSILDKIREELGLPTHLDDEDEEDDDDDDEHEDGDEDEDDEDDDDDDDEHGEELK